MDNSRYLFRGKRVDNGEWAIGHYCGDGEICLLNGLKPLIDIDPTTIGQCTGLKDKNGTLIFEGDILRLERCGSPEFDGTHRNGAVSWRHDEKYGGCWAFVANGKNDTAIIADKSEIIGNIHDDPELLKCGD